MAETLIMNGTFVTLLTPRDILESVDTLMGYDAKKYVEKLVDRLENDEYEMESGTHAFQEILDLVKKIEIEIGKSRTDKKQIKALLSEISREIYNQI